MLFNEIYERTAYAIQNNEAEKLIFGYGDYAVMNPGFPMPIPTLFTAVCQKGLYPYYAKLDEAEQAAMKEKIICAIRSLMASDNEVHVWWALSSLYVQKMFESDNKISPYTIADELIREISPYLIKNKEKLMNSDAYIGANYDDGGLWGDVMRHYMLFKKYYDIDIFG